MIRIIKKPAARLLTRYDLNQLFNLFVFRGILKHIRSDNESEVRARVIRKWLNGLGVKMLFIEPGSP